MKKVAPVLPVIVGSFFIIRAIVELFVIDFSDPSSYADDWGGPSLAGVLLVHCGLGVVAAIALFIWWRRRRSATTDEDGR